MGVLLGQLPRVGAVFSEQKSEIEKLILMSSKSSKTPPPESFLPRHFAIQGHWFLGLRATYLS